MYIAQLDYTHLAFNINVLTTDFAVRKYYNNRSLHA